MRKRLSERKIQCGSPMTHAVLNVLTEVLIVSSIIRDGKNFLFYINEILVVPW